MFFERHVHIDAELPIYYNHQERTSGEPKFEFHWHETVEWILVTQGQVEIRIHENTTCYKEGDLVVIDPQKPHCFRAVGQKACYHCMIPDNSILALGGIDPRSVHTEGLVDDEEIKDYYRAIVKEFSEKKTGYKTCIKAYILLMTSLLVRRFGTGSEEGEALGDNAMRITKDAIRYMEEHYAEDFSGEKLAQDMGFSRSYLCHVISKVTGQSLTENLLYVRCRKARELLRKGVPVGEVVYLAGFKNTSYFCRTYKRMMGATPSAHRKK